MKNVLVGYTYEAQQPSISTVIGERAKRVRHSQVCSIENRGYIYILYIVRAIRAIFVLITRKEGGA